MNGTSLRPAFVAAVTLGVTLAVCVQRVSAEAVETLTYGTPTRGVFTFKVHGGRLNVDGLEADFSEPSEAPGNGLTNWNIEFRFFDEKGKEYKTIKQPVQKGPTRSGRFVWKPDPKKDPDERPNNNTFDAKPGKVLATLNGFTAPKERIAPNISITIRP